MASRNGLLLGGVFLAAVLLRGGAAGAAGPFDLTVGDTIGKTWHDEPICWELTLAQGQWNGQGGALVRRDGRPLPAQAAVAEKHPDGSARRVEVRFLIDRLEKGAAARITCELGKPGPADTDLKIESGNGFLTLSNSRTAVRLPNGPAPAAPILGVRTASGRWTGGGAYHTASCKPVETKTEVLERGPVRLAARVTTRFDNGRSHAVTVSLASRSRSVDLDEQFDLGPDTMYRFKQYGADRDELAWEWWSWYGDVEGTKEDHPNNWFFSIGSEQFQPVQARYRGDMSTDADKGKPGDRGEFSYTLRYAKERRLEKYLAGHCQWRPDAVLWYAASPGNGPGDDVVAVFTHSVRNWRNPNVLPLGEGITLRTGANDMRILSQSQGRKLLVQCPIGLGRRVWALRASTVQESFAPSPPAAAGPGAPQTALTAQIVQRNLGLDIVRRWVTDWPVRGSYPRLFIRPEQKDAYYARFRGQGLGLSGHTIDTFLKNQDQAGFDLFYRDVLAQADRMIDGYFSAGTDNTTNYPGWMLGYWHGMVVACGLDNLLGSPWCKPEQARELRRKLAILTYCLASKDAWPDKQINYGWGSMNMPVGRWGGLVVMASALGDHPQAATWLKDAGRYYRMLLDTEYGPDGAHISCPHYSGASITSFYAWIILAHAGAGEDVARSEKLRRFARYSMQLMTPVDPRWGIRTLLTEGDSRPGSSSFPGILATLFHRSDPDLAGQLMQIWIDGGREAGSGMGIPERMIIDTAVPPRPPRLGPEVFPGFGAVLRYRSLGTPEEAYLTFLAGNFMIDHVNSDQMAFSWHEKGVPLTLYQGDMYVPGAFTAISHNTLCWDYRPEGGPTPGKGRPGDWYHDHGLPWVEHAKRPRLHLEVGWDQQKQKITDARGMVTRAADQPAAALVEGRLPVHAFSEVPTRANYSIAMQPQIAAPQVKLEKPFTWTRRLLYVKAPEAAGMNYLVVRDDAGAPDRHVPSFNYWSLSTDVQFSGRTARFAGQLGVDTDLYAAAPAEARFFKDSFTHDQCEPIVGAAHQRRYGTPFRETQVLARVEGRPGKGFLVAIFPRKAGEPAPAIENWAGDKGIKVSWKGQMHFALLDTDAQAIRADGVEARTSCLVLKPGDRENFVLALPAGGEARYAGRSLRSEGPAELQVVGGKATEVRGKPL